MVATPSSSSQRSCSSRAEKPVARDVGERVERPARQRAADAGEAVQRLDDHVAPLGEGRDHARDRLLRAGERGDAGVLGGRVDARVDVDGEPRRDLGELAGPDAPAEAPAGHRVRLRQAVEDDQPVAQRLGGEQARVAGRAEHQAAVDLVGEDEHVRVAREPRDQPVELAARRDRRRWGSPGC